MAEITRTLDIPKVHATRENIADYGLFIGADVPESGLSIPFYKGTVEEGHNLPFVCRGNAVLRTARISPRAAEVTWLERHMAMTQLFVGLGDAPFAMVLGKPTHERSEDPALPNFEDLRCFILAPGHGVMLHQGTWHDFPLAVDRPVTVMTANSPEVVVALAEAGSAREMDEGDVFKIDIVSRTGTQLRAVLP